MINLIQMMKQLFPNKSIVYHLSDLSIQSPDQATESNSIYIGIEKANKTRQFCCCTLLELISLYNHCSAYERSLYEIIFPTNLVKAYIDFEYDVHNNNDIEQRYTGIACSLKILYYALNLFDTNYDESGFSINNALHQFLVLEAYVFSDLYNINYTLHRALSSYKTTNIMNFPNHSKPNHIGQISIISFPGSFKLSILFVTMF